MVKNYKVITLCGSTKFKDEFLRIQKELTQSTKSEIEYAISIGKKVIYLKDIEK